MNLKKAMELIAAERAKFLTQIRMVDPQLAATLDQTRAPWFNIRNAADDEESTEVLIYEMIGGWFGVLASDFVADLSKITSKKISVRINSPGGSVFDSIAIYNALVKHPAEVTVYVDSLAASGASVIAMAGDKLTMMVGSQLMIHDASGVGLGDSREMREMADFLDKQSDNIATVYADRTKGDPAEIRQMMLAETWMFAQEAVDLGFADEVFTKPPKKKDEDAPKEGEEKPPEGEEGKPKEGEEAPSEDEELEDVMRRRFVNLKDMGFQYENRLGAPAPKNIVSDDDIDSIVNGFAKLKVGTRG